MLHYALGTVLVQRENLLSPPPSFSGSAWRGRWAADENTLAWHPCLKWTDTINPRDSKDPLTEQDKVSASAHSYTWPVAHEHSLALMAYIMHTAAKTDCSPAAALFLQRPHRISGYGTEAALYLFNRYDCYDDFCTEVVQFCCCLNTIPLVFETASVVSNEKSRLTKPVVNLLHHSLSRSRSRVLWVKWVCNTWAWKLCGEWIHSSSEGRIQFTRSM